jgi:hypothetical protein
MSATIGCRRNLFLASPLMRGDDVLALQQALVSRGAKLLQDGLFGAATRDAVLAFQAGANLVVDGIVGPATSGTLFSGTMTAVSSDDERARRCFDELQAKVWSPEQVCGIIANIARESRFNPAAVGDGGSAYGLAQWHPDRQAAFAQFKNRSIVGSTLEDQLDFIHFEMTGGRERRAGQRLRVARTAREAGQAVSRFYERPASADAEAELRGALAQAYLDRFQNLPNAAPAPQVAPTPHRTAGDILSTEGLNAMLQPHRLFKDSLPWSLSDDGVEASGSLAVSVGAGDGALVKRMFDSQRPVLVSALTQGHVPIELALAALCAASTGDGAPRMMPGCDLDDPNRTPDCVSAGLMQTTLRLAQTALGRPNLTLADLQVPDTGIRAAIAALWLHAAETAFDPPLVAAMYSVGTLRYDPRNRWKLFEGTPNYIDRFVRFFNAAMQVANSLDVPPQIASFQRLFEASTTLFRAAPDHAGRYIATDPLVWVGSEPIGTGQCVALVQVASGAPPTANWVRGSKVQADTSLAVGTAIATFDADGHYGNRADGTCHAALYLGQTAAGIEVVDQWKGQPPHRRVLHFNRPNTPKVDTGEAFFVVT